MNFSPDIKEEALSMLNQPNVVLPAGIKVGLADPVFFVSEIGDLSINAHLTIEHEGKNYKIGTDKSL